MMTSPATSIDGLPPGPDAIVEPDPSGLHDDPQSDTADYESNDVLGACRVASYEVRF